MIIGWNNSLSDFTYLSVELWITRVLFPREPKGNTKISIDFVIDKPLRVILYSKIYLVCFRVGPKFFDLLSESRKLGPFNDLNKKVLVSGH